MSIWLKIFLIEKRLRDFFVGAFRSLAPLLICLLGGVSLVELQGNGWVAPLVASIFFTFALELAASRAEAKTKSEIASKIIDKFASMGIMDD